MNIPMKNIISSTLILSLLTFTALCRSDSLVVAVSSNFHTPMKLISEEFEKRTNYKIILSSGSTKKQFTQIVNGAPFNFFIAADTETIKRLEKLKLTVRNSSFQYARGQLVVFSPQEDIDVKQLLMASRDQKIAIANPSLSPYGKASKELLKNLKIWNSQKNNIVSGINIEQAYQFIKTGNVEIGIIAKSQFMRIKNQSDHSYWIPPQNLYSPINQSAVLLTDNEPSMLLQEFFHTNFVLNLIQEFGYGLPNDK